MPERIAACDVGSNTVHLLVAEPTADGRAEEVQRVVLMPRIGAAVNATGRIGEAKIAEVCEALRGLAAVASAAGATVKLLAATEAVRRAGDREVALPRFGEAFGAPCVLLPGDVEARLSFRGAVAMSGHHHGIVLVCDIGGGSTELAVGTRHRLDSAASLPIGSGAATDRWLHDDPPSEAQRRDCFAAVVDALRSAPHAAALQHAIATGGTATSLPRLLGRHHESHLDADDLAECRRILAAAPSAEIAARFDLDPARARVLAGGVEIVDAVREVYALQRVQVTIHGLRSGMVLAYVAAGADWSKG